MQRDAAYVISRRTLLKSIGAGGGLLTMGGLLAACGDGSGEAASDELTPVTHQLGWLKITQFAGFFLAQERGYYEEEGIAATINAGGPNVIASQQVSAGQATVGDDDNTTVLQAIEQGQPLVMFATVFQESPYAVMSLPERPIRSLADFERTTIALTEATRPQLEPLLEQAGVDLASVEFVPAGPDPSQLATGQVDGYFGFATAQGVTLRQQGIDVVVTTFNELGFPSYANVLITTPERIEQERDTLVGFLRATIRGYQDAIDDPEEAGRLTATKYGPEDLDVETEIEVAKAQAPLIDNPDGLMRIDRDKMAAIVEAALASGSISTELDVDEIMTTEILEEAHGG